MWTPSLASHRLRHWDMVPQACLHPPHHAGFSTGIISNGVNCVPSAASFSVTSYSSRTHEMSYLESLAVRFVEPDGLSIEEQDRIIADAADCEFLPA